MSDAVLVTGAFGLVGTETVKNLAAAGHCVVATDLDTPTNRKAAAALPAGVEARWTNLTDSSAVDHLVAEVSPAVIVHLAGIIPPQIYRDPKLARRVNVDATATLVRVAEAQSHSPRFVQASSNAIHGARNPHRAHGLLRVDTPVAPSDLYGQHKVEAETHVRSSGLHWLVLRLGGVLSVQPGAMTMDLDAMFFESLLPTDGRMHSVDVRDVAAAFTAATTADVAREILLIGGDESHHLRQGDVARALAAASGMEGALPVGRPGNPDSDTDWFVTDWMDTAQAQKVLSFQHHSWPDMLGEIRSYAGWKRHPLRLLSPLAHAFLKRRAAYRDKPGRYADPWGAIRERWGEPGPDAS